MSDLTSAESALEHPSQNVSEEVSQDEAARKKMDFKLQIMLRRGLLKAYAVAVETGQEGENGNTASGLLASMVKDNLLLRPLKPSGSTGDLSKETGLFKLEINKETLLRVAQQTGAQALLLAQRELEERCAFTVLVVLDPTRPVNCQEMADLHAVCVTAKAQLVVQHDQSSVLRSRDAMWEAVVGSWGSADNTGAHVERYYGEQVAYLLRSQAHLSSFLLAAAACLVTCWYFYGLPSPPSTPSDWWRLLPWSLCWHGCLYFYWSKITWPWNSAIPLDAKPRGLLGPTPAEMEYFRLDERVRAAIVTQSGLSDREAAPLVSVTYSIPGPLELAVAVGKTTLAGVVGQWIWSYWLEFSVVPGIPFVGHPLQSMLASHCSVVCMGMVQARRVREAAEKDGQAETADIKVTKNPRGKPVSIDVRVPNRHACLKVYLALACSASLFLDYPLECLRGYVGGLWWSGPSAYWLAWVYGMRMAMYIALYGLLEVGLDFGAAWFCRLDPSLGWMQGLGANGARVFGGHLAGYRGKWDVGQDEMDSVIMDTIIRETGKNSHAGTYGGCDDAHLCLSLLASHVLFYGPLCPPLLVFAALLAVVVQITEWHKLCGVVRRPIPTPVGGNEKAWVHFLLVAVVVSLPVNTLTAYLVGGWRAFIAMAVPAAYTTYLIHTAWESKTYSSSEPETSPTTQARPKTVYETYRKEKRRDSHKVVEQATSVGIMQGS